MLKAVPGLISCLHGCRNKRQVQKPYWPSPATAGMPRAARRKREAIYSNGISYHLFASLGCYVQKPVWEDGGGDRVGKSSLFPLQAACQCVGEASVCACV